MLVHYRSIAGCVALTLETAYTDTEGEPASVSSTKNVGSPCKPLIITNNKSDSMEELVLEVPVLSDNSRVSSFDHEEGEDAAMDIPQPSTGGYASLSNLPARIIARRQPVEIVCNQRTLEQTTPRAGSGQCTTEQATQAHGMCMCAQNALYMFVTYM